MKSFIILTLLFLGCGCSHAKEKNRPPNSAVISPKDSLPNGRYFLPDAKKDSILPDEKDIPDDYKRGKYVWVRVPQHDEAPPKKAFNLVNEFRYITKTNPDTNIMKEILVRIDFFNADSQVIATYDVQANNPYSESKYKNIQQEYLDISSGLVDRTALPNYDWQKHTHHYANYTRVHENNMCGTLLLVYYREAFDAHNTLLDITATFVMFSKEGKQIARLDDVPNMFFGQGLLTCDEKYLCFTYGGAATEEFERMYNDNFFIYDIEAREFVYKKELPKVKTYLEPIEIHGGYILLSEQNYDFIIGGKDDGIIDQKVFNIKDGVIHKYSFDVNFWEDNAWVHYTDDGFEYTSLNRVGNTILSGITVTHLKYTDLPTEKFYSPKK